MVDALSVSVSALSESTPPSVETVLAGLSTPSATLMLLSVVAIEFLYSCHSGVRCYALLSDFKRKAFPCG